MQYYYSIGTGLKADLSQYELFRDRNTRAPFSMDYRERGVYPTQYTSRMGTARVKQEEEADKRIIVKEYEI